VSDHYAQSAAECPARLTGNCKYPEVLVEQVASSRRAEARATEEAYRYRRLWEFASAALVRAAYKPLGPDERRMMAAARAMPGLLNSGKTDGWLDWLPLPDDPQQERLLP
jgi:hypothetical protein